MFHASSKPYSISNGLNWKRAEATTVPHGFLEDEHPNKALLGQASAPSCLLPHGSMTGPLVASFIFHEGFVILVVSRLQVSLGAPLILIGRLGRRGRSLARCFELCLHRASSRRFCGPRNNVLRRQAQCGSSLSSVN